MANEKGQKNNDNKISMPPPLKSVEEGKRRVVFLSSSDAPAASKKIAQDILHALNMKFLSMRLPAHLRLIKLGYNERGNLTGLKSAETTADIMTSRFREVILLIAQRFDPHVKEFFANQQWIGLKVHEVELGRCYPLGGLEQIRQEIAAGPSAIEIPFIPR